MTVRTPSAAGRELLLRASRDALSATVAAELEEAGAARDARVVLGVSGGGDSIAMMLLVAAVKDRTPGGLDAITVVSVDHGLRAEGREEAEYAISCARELGIASAGVHRVEISPSGNLLASAREARRVVFEQALAQCEAGHLLLAHQADDRAEGLLLALSRGSALDAAANILPRREFLRRDGSSYTVCRPLLACRRAELRAFLDGVGMRWIEDPSNALRARGAMRGSPELSKLVDRIAGSAGPFLDEAAELLGLRDRLADAALASGGNVVPRSQFEALPSAVQREVLRRLIAQAGAVPSGAAIERIVALSLRRDTAPHRFACGSGLELLFDRKGLSIVRAYRNSPADRAE